MNDTRAILGEGAIWHEGRLYWVDIEGKSLYIFDPTTSSQRRMQFDSMIGTVVPRESEGLAVALATGFALVDVDSGEVAPIADPEAHLPGNRFNDGKCDPAGRFWAGTMSYTFDPGAGSLYMLDGRGRVHKMLDRVTVSNGICWSHDGKTMYYIDTPTQRVDAFDFDLETGQIADRRTVIEIPHDDGSPDGMTIDAEGNLWVALWGGYAVVRYDPRTGRRLQQVPVPAGQVTSCAFGGEGLQDLYITSASTGLSAERLAREPLAGALFRTRVDVPGVPAFAYRG